MIGEFNYRDLESLLAKVSLSRNIDKQNSQSRSAFGHLPDSFLFKNLILDYFSNALKFPEVEYASRESDLRLRIALHLSTPDSVYYEKSRREARWELIKKNLINDFDFEIQDAEKIARLVATVLDSWDVERDGGLSTHRYKIMVRQNYKCASCHLNFNDKQRVSDEEIRALNNTHDHFKPYFDGNNVSESMQPQVDHIYVVSRDGTNSIDNLQVLCALCNQGKGDGSGVRASIELEYCHLLIHEIPRYHRMKLLFTRLKMDGYRCQICGTNADELTVRKKRNQGLTVLTNLYSICYGCL